MHKIFQQFIDLLASADRPVEFSNAMALTATALDLSCFAYLSLSATQNSKPRLLSTYPPQWTTHYLQSRYERIDPVVVAALDSPEPFRWGADLAWKSQSPAQQRLFDEAAQFGIRFGFTVPIHDGRSPIAVLTFASDQRNASFEQRISTHGRVLQLMAMYFHAHVSRKFASDHSIDGIALSRREFECLEWASRGKSAWEIGCILGLSRNTVAYYLENAKQKLGVRTVVQAVTRLAAANKEKRN